LKRFVIGRAVAGALVLAIVACVKAPSPEPEWQRRQAKLNEITALWTQVREWRRELGMELDPSPQSLFQIRGRKVSEVKKICPNGHSVHKTCADVCVLAGHICDNAETICIIADELGKNDQLAQEKCTSAKASCKEAKQRCCDKCSAAPPAPAPPAPAPAVQPAPVPGAAP
jgi:hypothetical protein